MKSSEFSSHVIASRFISQLSKRKPKRRPTSVPADCTCEQTQDEYLTGEISGGDVLCHLLLANDPTCIDGLGLYRWRLENGRLFFEVIDDPCAIKLRGLNLPQQPWICCRPSNTEAAVTDHWPKPVECE